MAKVYSKALDKNISVERIIGQINGKLRGPTIVFLAGIHGNEPAAVFALHQVFRALRFDEIYGNVYGIAGNLWALERGTRYQKEDLNRIWDDEHIQQLERANELDAERKEQKEVYEILRGILQKENGPFYFLDLHTTSSETVPFMTVNDNLLNRKFSSQYPVPMILGIEEYLEGPLLSFVNELGYVAFGFEGGQHDSLTSIDNHIAFIHLTLIYAGCLNGGSILLGKHFSQLAESSHDVQNVYEIYYRYKINDGENFTMLPGFVNFQQVKKGSTLAKNNNHFVYATHDGNIFMPLYQGQGDDGFFAIRTIPSYFLKLSVVLRKVRLDQFLRLLPGISRPKGKKNALLVNKKIARFFAKDFFHLLGYRSQKVNGHHLLMKNRERFSRTKDYSNANWY
ncbi:MAG: succinylglutamate desuccinylase/aspartoacylase family protein [Reichenbachiella sp.]